MVAKASVNPVKRAQQRRDAVLKRGGVPAAMTAKQRETILQLLEEGATLSEIFTMRGICGLGTFYRARHADAVFDAEVRRCLAQGAEAAIAEAAELSRKAADSNNPDEMRIAEAFHRCALAYAEKCAPKEYGQLLKLGSTDGGPLSLSVVTYAMPLLASAVPKDGQMLAAPRAEPIDADFSDA